MRREETHPSIVDFSRLVSSRIGQGVPPQETVGREHLWLSLDELGWEEGADVRLDEENLGREGGGDGAVLDVGRRESFGEVQVVRPSSEDEAVAQRMLREEQGERALAPKDVLARAARLDDDREERVGPVEGVDLQARGRSVRAYVRGRERGMSATHELVKLASRAKEAVRDELLDEVRVAAPASERASAPD